MELLKLSRSAPFLFLKNKEFIHLDRINSVVNNQYDFSLKFQVEKNYRLYYTLVVWITNK